MRKTLDKKNLTRLVDALRPGIPSLIVATFFLILGISAGACIEIFLDDDAKKGLFSFLATGFSEDIASTDDLIVIFRLSCLQNMGLLLIIALSGFTVIGFPLIFISLIYKGSTLGFASTLLMDALGAEGALLAVLTLVPPNIIIVPAILLSAVLGIDYSTSIIRFGPGKTIYCVKKNTTDYFLLQSFLLFVTLIGSFIEGFICPFLQRLSI